MPTKSEAIRQYVKSNPGCTTKGIGAALGFPQGSIATVLTVEHTRPFAKQPYYPLVLTRKEGGRTLSNVPYYTWAYKVSETVPQKQETVPPKKEKHLPEVRSSPIQSAIDALVGSIVAAIKPQLHAAIAEAIHATNPAQRIEYKQPPETPPMLPAPARLPRVVITGLLPYQAGQIATEFGSSLEVSCWDGGSHSQLAAMAKQADAVFNHTKHGGHATESTLKTIGADLIRVSGGMTSMRRALREFITQGQGTQ